MISLRKDTDPKPEGVSLAKPTDQIIAALDRIDDLIADILGYDPYTETPHDRP